MTALFLFFFIKGTVACVRR